MKKILSIALAIMLMIMAVPFSVFAEKYYDVDFTKTLSLDTAYSGTIDATDPLIDTTDWSGYAKGFTISLEEGKTYKITATATDPNATYIDRCVAVFASPLTNSFYADCLTNGYGTSVRPGTTVTHSCTIDIYETGEYKVLVWGYCLDSDDNDLTGGSLTVSVEENDIPTKDIYTVQDLLDARETIESGETIDALNFMADIDMSSTDWTSFPYVNRMTVRGNGFKITGLNNPLFGSVEVLNASDLTFDSFKFTSATGAASVGVLAGYINMGKITNCSVTGSIDIPGGYAYNVGGLIGGIENGATLKNCSSDINITIDAPSQNINCVGGLVGYAIVSSTFDNCATKGTITIKDAARQVYYIGGFAGSFEDYELCNNCSADVDVVITTAGEDAEIYYIGGFTGYIDEACGFANCWSAGSINIEGKHDGSGYIGGFNGYSNYCGDTHCYNCYSITDVKGGTNCVGSFFGSAYYNDTFKNCYAAGDVTFVIYDGTEDGPYNGLFIGDTHCLDDLVIENCFVKKDKSGESAPKIVDSYGGDISSVDITEVDFSDSAAIADMTKALNDARDAFLEEYNNDFLKEYYDLDGIEKLFAWGKANEKGGPIFANRTVRFLDENDNEVLVLTDLFDGDNFSSQAPAVPAKEGFTGKWDTNFIVDGDMDVYAVYEKDSNNSDPGSKDPGNNNNNNNKNNEDVPTSPETGNTGIILMILGALLVTNMVLIVKAHTSKAK